MNSSKKIFQSTMCAASLMLTFASANAEPKASSAPLAQATSQQSAPQNEGTSGDSSSGSTSTGAGQSGSTQGASGKSESAQTSSSKANTTGPIYLLVPVGVANTDTNMKNGCWARIYDQENYVGDSLTLAGPTALADMDNSGFFGLNWDDRVNSIELGPKATLTVFDNENFLDRVAQFKPGQKIPDVSKRMGYFDEFASVKIDCQQG